MADFSDDAPTTYRRVVDPVISGHMPRIDPVLMATGAFDESVRLIF